MDGEDEGDPHRMRDNDEQVTKRIRMVSETIDIEDEGDPHPMRDNRRNEAQTQLWVSRWVCSAG